MPSAAYWSALGIMIVPIGAAMKYLVWDFLHMPQTMHDRFSSSKAEAQASIHAQKFLPVMVSIYEAVSDRKAFLPAASTIEVLSELAINADIRKAASVVTERIELDRWYERAIRLSKWVSAPWLLAVFSSLSIFFVYHHVDGGLKGTLLWILAGASIVSGVIGGTALGLFLNARNRLIELIGANRF